MGLESILHAVKTGLAQPLSTVKHVIKAATIAACLTGAFAGLDLLTHSYATASTIDIGAIVGIGNYLVQASVTNIDPLTYLQSNYAWESAIPNPHPTWGKITGADGIDNGTKAIFIWENGKSATYSSDMSSQISTFDFGVSNATGIAEVPPGFLGFEKAKYAVSDFGNVSIYSSSGSELGHRGVQSSTINDIDFNAKNQQLGVATQSNGTGYLKGDGTLTPFSGSSAYGTEFIYLTQNNGIAIDSLYQNGKYFFRTFEDGSYSLDGFKTNLAGTGAMQGVAYTTEKAIMATPTYILVYGPLGFQPFMNYSVLPSELKDPTVLIPTDPVIENKLVPSTETNGAIAGVFIKQITGIP